MSKWKSIETAPKNKLILMVAKPYGDWYIGYYHGMTYGENPKPCASIRIDMGDLSLSYTVNEENRPTHWAELPCS